jgi:hypothetical protein
MDLASFAGDDFLDVTLDGEGFRVGELTLADWAPVQAWIKAKVPGPLAILSTREFLDLPPAAKREVVQEAMRQQRVTWPPQLGRQEWFAALDHEGGHAAVLKAILGKYQPVTPARCDELAERCSMVEILPCVVAALGLFDPKSPAPATPTPTTTGATGDPAGATSATSPTRSRRPGGGRRKTS